jgi:Tol biopolymer transport system component
MQRIHCRYCHMSKLSLMKKIFFIATISILFFSCKKSSSDIGLSTDLENFYFAGTPSSSNSAQQIFYNNGLAEIQLTNFPNAVSWTVSNGSPRLTADGKRIFFTSTKDNASGEIFYMNVDGSNLVKAVDHTLAGGMIRDISLYQNGQKIIFNQEFGTYPNRYSQVCKVNSDGTGLVALTSYPADGSCYDPWVNETANKVLYSCLTNTGRKIYSMGLDGSNKHQLTSSGPGDQLHPQISPDGTKIVFEGWWPPYDADIFIMDIDGNNVKQLTNYSAYGTIATKFSLTPSFSKDGSQVYYSSNSNTSHYQQICRMNTDGSNAVLLTGSNYDKSYPVK